MKTQWGGEQEFTATIPYWGKKKTPTAQTRASGFNGHTPLAFTVIFICQGLAVLSWKRGTLALFLWPRDENLFSH